MKISVLTPTIRPQGLDILYQSLKNQTLQEFEWLVEVSFPERGHDLNAAYNKLLRRAQGELIVSVQDFHKLPPNFLQTCWNAYQENPDTLFTCPVGKTLDWENAEWDWRIHKEANMDWMRWEIDCGFAPMKMFKDVGGFDEELDKFWTFDNVSVGFRADQLGYKFGFLPDNKVLAYDHDKTIEHPFRKNYNPDHWNERLDEYRRGKRLNYL